MITIRNKTGAVASLNTVNSAQDVPDDGDVDLSVVDAGSVLPRELDPGANVELQEAIRSGSWAVVRDGVELSIGDAIAALTSVDAQAFDSRVAQRQAGTLSLTSGDWSQLLALPVGADESIAVVVEAFHVIASPSGGRARSGIYTMLCVAARVGAADLKVVAQSGTKAEFIPGDRLEFAPAGNDLVLRYRASLTEVVPYTLTYLVP